MQLHVHSVRGVCALESSKARINLITGSRGLRVCESKKTCPIRIQTITMRMRAKTYLRHPRIRMNFATCGNNRL